MTTAIILTGGRGDRMGLFTKAEPLHASDRIINRYAVNKTLSDVCGRPALFHNIRAVRRAGINDFGIDRFHLGQTVEDRLEDNKDLLGDDIRFTYSGMDSLKGTAASLKLAADKKGPVLVCYGDLTLGAGFNFRKFLQFHDSKKADVTILVKSVPDARKCGIVHFDRDSMRISGLEEKPFLSYQEPVPGWINCAIYALSDRAREEALSLLAPGEDPENRKNDYMRNIFPGLMDKGLSFRAYDLGTIFWQSTDNLRQLFDLNWTGLRGSPEIVIPNLVPLGPLSGRGVSNSYIDPDAVIDSTAVLNRVIIGSGWEVSGRVVNSMLHSLPPGTPKMKVAKGVTVKDSFVLSGDITSDVSGSVVASNGSELVFEPFS